MEARPILRAQLSRAVFAATTHGPRISHDLVKAAHGARCHREREVLLDRADRACRELLDAIGIAQAAVAGTQAARKTYRAPRLDRWGQLRPPIRGDRR